MPSTINMEKKMENTQVQFTPFQEGDKVEEVESRQFLVFDLTDAEILAIAEVVGKLAKEKSIHEVNLAEIKKSLGDKIKGLDSDIHHNHKLIETRKEGRDVPCLMRKNYTKKIVQFVYEGKTMKERPMEAYEIENEKVRPQDNTVSTLNT